MTTDVAVADPLVVRGAAFGLFARLLGEDPAPLASGAGLTELRFALEALGETEALTQLDAVPDIDPDDERSIGRVWVRLFDQGKVPPHETSYLPVGLGGHTSTLADVAGFYKAFGMKVHGERSDHVVAQLEFASLVTLLEANHRNQGNDDGAAVCADAAAKFLREHLGCWLDRFSAKLVAIDPDGPYGPIVAAMTTFVANECGRREVTPLYSGGLFVTAEDVGIHADLDSELPSCTEEFT